MPLHALRVLFSRSPLCSPGAYHRLVGFLLRLSLPLRPSDHSLQAQAFAPRPLCRRCSIDCVPQEAVARAGRREPWRGVWRGDFVPASRRRRAQRLSGAARSDFGGYRIKGNVGRAGTVAPSRSSTTASTSTHPSRLRLRWRAARAIAASRETSARKACASYASGEDRLRQLAGLSDRVRSGVGTGVVSTSQRDTIADDGYDAEVGGGASAGTSAKISAASKPIRFERVVTRV